MDEQLAALPGGRRPACARASRAPSSTPPTRPRPSASRRAAFDMVRCGIALYGCSPVRAATRPTHDLRPAMSLVSYLASVKTLRSRESAGYGRVWRAAAGHADRPWCRWATPTATPARSPAGPRCWWAGGGCRWWAPSRWTSSRWTSARRAREGVGEEVVLLGAQGGERITAEERRGLARDDQLRGDLRRRRRGCPGSRGVSAGARGPRRPARAPRGRRPGPWAAACATRCSAARWPTSTWPWTATPRPPPRALARAHGATRFRAVARRSARGGCRAATSPSRSTSRRSRARTIAEDLARRDLTVNALALPLARPARDHRPPRRPAPTSPARRLRLVSPRALSGRPRAPAAPGPPGGQLGFAIDAGTAARARADAPRIWDARRRAPGRRAGAHRVAAERPTGRSRGWTRSACSGRSSPSSRSRAGLDQSAVPPQGRPRAHARGGASTRRSSPPTPSRSSARRAAAGPPRSWRAAGRRARRRGRRSMLGALLHDMAKPATPRRDGPRGASPSWATTAWAPRWPTT